jgi:hypothetical protein
MEHEIQTVSIGTGEITIEPVEVAVLPISSEPVVAKKPVAARQIVLSLSSEDAAAIEAAINRFAVPLPPIGEKFVGNQAGRTLAEICRKYTMFVDRSSGRIKAMNDAIDKAIEAAEKLASSQISSENVELEGEEDGERT